MKKYLIIVSLFILISCESDKDLNGPCVHNYNEPILNIISIRDTLKNIVLPFIEIRNLRINGHLQSGINPITESYSIVANDSIYYCNLPFGFGIEEGSYEFLLIAEGYEPKHILIEDVNYAVFDGGCPSYNDVGKKIELYIN